MRTRLAILLTSSLAIALAPAALGQARPESRRPIPPDGGGGAPQPAEETTIERRRPMIADAETRVIALKHAEATDISRVLTQVAGSIGVQAMITADPRSNTLILVAPKAGSSQLAEIVSQLDTPLAIDSPAQFTTRSVVVRAGRAQETAKLVIDLFGRQSRELRIAPDAFGNVVWIAGESQLAERVAQVVQQINQTAGGADDRDEARSLRYYTLKHADARELENTVNQIASTIPLNTRVVADPRSQTLVANVTDAQHACIADIVAKLDVPPRDPPKPRGGAGPADGTRQAPRGGDPADGAKPEPPPDAPRQPRPR